MKKVISRILTAIDGNRKLFYISVAVSLMSDFIFVSYIDIVKRLINSVIVKNFDRVIEFMILAASILLIDISLNYFLIIIRKQFNRSVLSKLRIGFYLLY